MNTPLDGEARQALLAASVVHLLLRLLRATIAANPAATDEDLGYFSSSSSTPPTFRIMHLGPDTCRVEWKQSAPLVWVANRERPRGWVASMLFNVQRQARQAELLQMHGFAVCSYRFATRVLGVQTAAVLVDDPAHRKTSRSVWLDHPQARDSGPTCLAILVPVRERGELSFHVVDGSHSLTLMMGVGVYEGKDRLWRAPQYPDLDLFLIDLLPAQVLQVIAHLCRILAHVAQLGTLPPTCTLSYRNRNAAVPTKALLLTPGDLKLPSFQRSYDQLYNTGAPVVDEAEPVLEVSLSVKPTAEHQFHFVYDYADRHLTPPRAAAGAAEEFQRSGYRFAGLDFVCDSPDELRLFADERSYKPSDPLFAIDETTVYAKGATEAAGAVCVGIRLSRTEGATRTRFVNTLLRIEATDKAGPRTRRQERGPGQGERWRWHLCREWGGYER